MAMQLGYDGKRRAMAAALGLPTTPISDLYLGLLQAAPATMDGMSLSVLVGAGQGNEFSINANFYTSRKLVLLDQGPTDSNGAVASNIDGLTWTNTSGSGISIAAMFITDAPSGTSGEVLWVGVPKVGTAYVANTRDAELASEGLLLKVD